MYGTNITKLGLFSRNESPPFAETKVRHAAAAWRLSEPKCAQVGLNAT